MGFRERVARFMYGRYGSYGPDRLSRALNIFILALIVLSFFVHSLALSAVTLAALAFMVFRMFSRNYAARQRENAVFARLADKASPLTRAVSRIVKPAARAVFTALRGTARRISHARTHRYYRCPGCARELRVPKVSGRLEITCPKCRRAFVVGRKEKHGSSSGSGKA